MYYVLKNDYSDWYVLVTKQSDLESWNKISRGASMLDGWPDGLTMQYSDDNPEGVMLTDQITHNELDGRK